MQEKEHKISSLIQKLEEEKLEVQKRSYLIIVMIIMIMMMMIIR